MPLLYALVARGKIVLCDHAEVSGNFEALSQNILQTKREDGSKIRSLSPLLFSFLISPPPQLPERPLLVPRVHR